MDLLIKKNQIAINTEDARSSRFVQGDRVDAAISEINIEKRKIGLSIKLQKFKIKRQCQNIQIH